MICETQSLVEALHRRGFLIDKIFLEPDEAERHAAALRQSERPTVCVHDQSNDEYHVWSKA